MMSKFCSLQNSLKNLLEICINSYQTVKRPLAYLISNKSTSRFYMKLFYITCSVELAEFNLTIFSEKLREISFMTKLLGSLLFFNKNSVKLTSFQTN